MSQELKADAGKLDFTLLDDMPRALGAVVEVLQWAITPKEEGGKGYVRSSWLQVHPSRYRAALLRHHFGETRHPYDQESHLLHKAHKAVNALFELELALRRLESIEDAKYAEEEEDAPISV